MLKKAALLQDKKIAVIGGGPGGLTLARLLQRNGAAVNVYERDINKDARIQGAIVDLHFDSGLQVMEAAGLMDAFKASYMPGADKYRLLDKEGNSYLDEYNNSSDAGFGDKHFRPEIGRGALRNMLCDALLPGTMVWDSQLTDMQQVADKWILRFRNGSAAEADIVIGADGYRSKVRAYVTDITALYSGAAIIQGEIDHPETDCPGIYELVNNANLAVMDEGKNMAAQPRGDGGLTFYAASLYPEDWAATSGIDFKKPEEVYAYLAEFYKEWSPVFLQLFKACKQFTWRPLNYFPLDQYWEAKNNITIMGDAAHLMPPSGEGVNTAMLDALDLTTCLTDGEYESIHKAIAAYEQQMRARAAVLGREALDGIKGWASPDETAIKELVAMLTPKR